MYFRGLDGNSDSVSERLQEAGDGYGNVVEGSSFGLPALNIVVGMRSSEIDKKGVNTGFSHSSVV